MLLSRHHPVFLYRMVSHYQILYGKKMYRKDFLAYRLLKKVDRYLILPQTNPQFGRDASKIDNASIAGQRVVQIGK